MRPWMNKVVGSGRLIFAVAISAIGAENVICARDGEAVFPVIPFLPGIPLLAYLAGIALLAAGLSIATKIKARLAATLLGVLFFLCVVFLQISRVAASPLDIAVRTGAFETLAFCASAWILAGTLPIDGSRLASWDNAASRLAAPGRYFFAVSSVIFGIDHLLIPQFIASLVPAWIPWSLFWAYFTGAAFIAAGVCIAIRWMADWAAALLGKMFLLWFLLLHVPRVATVKGSHNPDEWSSAFIALGICGGCWIAARAASTETQSREFITSHPADPK